MNKLLQFIGATTIGYVAGILMAPKSGKETRAELTEKADRLREVATQKTEEAKVVYEKSSEIVKEGASEIGVEAKAFAKKARTTSSHVKHELGELRNEAEKRAGRAFKTVDKTAHEIGNTVRR